MWRKLYIMVVPVTIVSAVVTDTHAFAGGFFGQVHPSLSINVDDTPFVDATEEMVFTRSEGKLLVENPLDTPVVCLIGKINRSSGKSPSLDGTKSRGGYLTKQDTIRLNHMSGQWAFKVGPNDSHMLHNTMVHQIGTLQCTAVDYVIENRCTPGMNIHACVKQGLM
jgi:hypothetical protein